MTTSLSTRIAAVPPASAAPRCQSIITKMMSVEARRRYADADTRPRRSRPRSRSSARCSRRVPAFAMGDGAVEPSTWSRPTGTSSIRPRSRCRVVGCGSRKLRDPGAETSRPRSRPSRHLRGRALRGGRRSAHRRWAAGREQPLSPSRTGNAGVDVAVTAATRLDLAQKINAPAGAGVTGLDRHRRDRRAAGVLAEPPRHEQRLRITPPTATAGNKRRQRKSARPSTRPGHPADHHTRLRRNAKRDSQRPAGQLGDQTAEQRAQGDP